MKPTCFDCIHSVISGGYAPTSTDPGMPDMAECDFPDDPMIDEIGDRLEWQEELMPEECGHFSPRLIEECFNCKKLTKIVAWNWPLKVNGLWETHFCCSQGCMDEVIKKIEREMEEYSKDSQ